MLQLCLLTICSSVDLANTYAMHASQLHPCVLTADKAGADTDVDDSVSIDEGDAAAGIIGSSSAWSRLAAQLPADISEQPAGLKGGQLREYQMQVT